MLRDFPQIDLENFPDKLQKLIEKQRKQIDTLLQEDRHSYEKLIKPLEDMEEDLEVFFTPLSHLNSTANTEQTQKAYEKSLPLISAHQSRTAHDIRLYKALGEISPKNDEQSRVLELTLRDLRLMGAELGEKEKKRIEEIDIRLSELGSDFERNLLEAANRWEMVLDDPEDVKGMPPSDLEAAKIEKNGTITWRFTLQTPSYISYMTYGPNRARREELYRAYTTRASANEKVIDEILELREEKASLLRYDSYADYALQTRDAQSSKEVLEFLDRLIEAAYPQAKAEIEELRAFAKELDGIELSAYDTAYYSEKLKKRKFGFDDAATKPYFSSRKVLQGLLDIVSKLFDISFVQTDVPVWHESVKVYDIYENDTVTGRIYFDLEARETKRSGAWMHDWESHYVDRNGKEHLPSAFVVANFSPSDKSTPSLLRHDDVVTLFHEMGHALHHLLSRLSERSISGINGVAWDAVEFPSQFLENFAYEKAILERFARHYETDEPIPDDLAEKVKQSKNFQAASGILRQTEFALFDMLLHQKPYRGEEVQKLLESIRERTALVEVPSYNRFQHGFSHIFAGGYAAGYYSYKWAEVLSAEAFFACLDPDKGIDPDMAKSYRETILSRGALKPMKKLFEEWLGYSPKVDKLMRLYDIEEEKIR